jgi:phenylacetaldehyde dehydrogenase
VEGLAEAAQGIQLGHGLLETTQMGPLVSKVQAERVWGFMSRACDAGARVVTGGDRPDPAGAFISPTVITDVSTDMEIVREEVFGPVIVCAPFDDIAEVTELANATDYGLAASVWTESLSTAHRLASDVQAGTVWINCHSMYDASLPIGGIKQSGWSRLSGQQAVDNFLNTKTVCSVI